MKKRNKLFSTKWRLENPDYFQKRYSYLFDWRKKNPDYQRQWRAKRSEIQNLVPNVTPLKSIRFVTPVILFNNEIQNLVVHVTVDKTLSYDTMDRVGEIQKSIAISP